MMDYMVKHFFKVSLDYTTSGCDNICYTALEVKETLSDFIVKSEFIEKYNENDENGVITITEYEVSDEIMTDLTKDEFVRMFFDNIEWVMDGITEIGHITLNL